MRGSTAQRRVRALVVVGVAVAGLFPVGAPVAHAGPAPAPTASGTLGVDNPSGKADARGRPLNRNAHHAAAAPRVGATADTPAPECPATVRCVFVPAAYQQDDPADPSNYGNYDVADRPADGLAINTIVIHDTEGSLQSTINAFQDPLFYVSAHYVIDTDGTIYQMVRTKDVAWHAGNWWVNTHAIGIEHVGFAAAGNYPPAQYDASAKLVRWLAHRYGVPLDRQHVIGHDNVPAPDAAHVASMHWDPGPFWNWQHYMARLGVPVLPTGPGTRMVTVAPVWPLSQQPVTDCSSGTCVPLPAQPTNFVYLRQAPDATAPFLVDPVLGAGTTAADSVAAKAYLGQNLAVADHRFTADGVWLQVWYGGQQGWLFSPWRAPSVFPAAGSSVTPRAGSIPVYGRAYPEASAYPAGFTAAPAVVALPYTIPAGQRYSVVGGVASTDYYHAVTVDSSAPFDHTVFKGTDGYVRIQFNGREAFVRRADVTIAG